MSCNTDYEIPLPNGYILARISPGEFVIVAPDRRHIVVGPTVDEYAVMGDVVVGHVRASNGKQSYFIIDSRNVKVDDGLSREDWIRKLAMYRISGVHLGLPHRPARARQ